MPYHINPQNGNVNRCTASIRDCKYAVNGRIPEHYENKEGAYKAYENIFNKRIFIAKNKGVKSIYETQLFNSFNEAQSNYFAHGARSSKKIESIHKAIATHFLEAGLKVAAKGVGENKEAKVPGKLYDKNCDITIFDENDNPSSVIEVKFITTNYKQNANNYFENLMGATSNLRRNGIKVSQFIIIPSDIPYLDKSGDVKKLETITNKDIDKYRKLMAEPNDSSTPNNLFFLMIDMWKNVKLDSPISEFKETSMSSISPTKINSTRFNDENIDFLNKYGNYDKFVSNVISQN